MLMLPPRSNASPVMPPSSPPNALRTLRWTVDGRPHVLRLRGMRRAAQPNVQLMSVVGPMVSWCSHPAGVVRPATAQPCELRVERLDGYTFDLRAHLLGLTQNPELRTLLATSRVRTRPRSHRPDPLGFWIERWDAVRQSVDLRVQFATCPNGPRSCTFEIVALEIPAPPEWIPWLEDAYLMNGFLGVLDASSRGGTPRVVQLGPAQAP